MRAGVLFWKVVMRRREVSVFRPRVTRLSSEDLEGVSRLSDLMDRWMSVSGVGLRASRRAASSAPVRRSLHGISVEVVRAVR